MPLELLSASLSRAYLMVAPLYCREMYPAPNVVAVHCYDKRKIKRGKKLLSLRQGRNFKTAYKFSCNNFMQTNKRIRHFYPDIKYKNTFSIEMLTHTHTPWNKKFFLSKLKSSWKKLEFFIFVKVFLFVIITDGYRQFIIGVLHMLDTYINMQQEFERRRSVQ